MKSKINLLFVLCLSFFGTYGQTCIETVELGLPPFGGDLPLTVDDFVDNPDASGTYVITPATVSCSDVGTPVSVTTEGPNGFTCISTLTVVDDIPPVVVMEQNVVVSLTSDGTANLFAETVDNGSYDACTPVTLSISPSTFTCDDIGEVQVWLTVEDENGNFNQSWAYVTITEGFAPIILANDYINVSFDNNGEAVITFDMVEEGSGSYDECSTVTKSLSQTNFDCDDAGEQNVILTVEDESGNISTEIITINFEDKLKPVPYAVDLSTALLSTGPGNPFPSVMLYAEDFDFGSTDNCGIVNMTINKDFYTCEDIGENEVIFTVYDAAGNSDFAVTSLTIVDNTESASSLTCNNNITNSSFPNLPYTVTPYDVLEGGPYGCEYILYLTIEDEDGNTIPDNQITSEYFGQTLTYTVSDFNSSQSCWGTILMQDAEECDFNEDENITWPLEQIDINLLGVDPNDLTPEYLQNELDFAQSDVLPTFNNIDPACFIGYTYDDVIFTNALNIDKILRTFTVIDWYTYDASNGNEGLFEFVQLIKNLNSSNSFICDFLPRSAVVGDCDSGHTLDDDVEWPNNISIADHRITPTELINYSAIASEDSEPFFYGEDTELYTASYQDLVGSLTTDVLTVNRVWTVVRDGIDGVEWTYTQDIEVLFAQFLDLVAVNTLGSRGVPEVLLGNNILTDQYGKAIVEDEFFINPALTTAPLNGVDLVDLYLAREHVLGRIELNEYQLIAAEYNNDQELSTIDLVLLQKTILGLDQDNNDWQFINITEDLEGINQVRGHYIAYKQGDVDDSALLPGQSAVNLNQVDLSFEDQLLNDGESYTIPFYSESMINASGVELRMNYDPSIIEVLDVSSEMFGTDVTWRVDETSGILTILAYDIDENHLLDGSVSLFDISATALENSVLHFGLEFSDDYRSFIIDDELYKFAINGTLENGIGLGTNNKDFASGISVYPNPAVDYINVDLSKTDIVSDFIITLYDINGRQVAIQANNEQINIHTLDTGSYVLVLTSGDNYYSELVHVSR